eukprot:TRINITY_DN5722_c0_g1_i3.p1 TRINITY_DN5722_c0_g1~~TRINITY_DN5722_c0_g1_i3.p1  ORF type:complete len:767 (+),score=141.60 TRINITY_DN5722_c0_g1_i3:2715-5015(+)
MLFQRLHSYYRKCPGFPFEQYGLLQLISRKGKSSDAPDNTTVVSETAFSQLGPHVFVWLGKESSSGDRTLISTVEQHHLGSIDGLRLIRLASVIKDFSHPLLLKYLGVVQNEKQVGVIAKLPDGILLRDYLLQRPGKRLSETEARSIIIQVLDGLEYCWSKNVVHRNLGLKNIFIKDREEGSVNITLGDFIICNKWVPYEKDAMSSVSFYHFVSPECWIENHQAPTFASDLWSVGILIYVLCCGCYPFDGRDEFDLFLAVKRGEFVIPNSLSDQCTSLLKSLLRLNPAERPTMDMVRQHDWLNGTSPTFMGPVSQRRGSISAQLPFQLLGMSLNAAPAPPYTSAGVPPIAIKQPPEGPVSPVGIPEPDFSRLPRRSRSMSCAETRRASLDPIVENAIMSVLNMQRREGLVANARQVSQISGTGPKKGRHLRRSSDSSLHEAELAKRLALDPGIVSPRRHPTEGQRTRAVGSRRNSMSTAVPQPPPSYGMSPGVLLSPLLAGAMAPPSGSLFTSQPLAQGHFVDAAAAMQLPQVPSLPHEDPGHVMAFAMRLHDIANQFQQECSTGYRLAPNDFITPPDPVTNVVAPSMGNTGLMMSQTVPNPVPLPDDCSALRELLDLHEPALGAPGHALAGSGHALFSSGDLNKILTSAPLNSLHSVIPFDDLASINMGDPLKSSASGSGLGMAVDHDAVSAADADQWVQSIIANQDFSVRNSAGSASLCLADSGAIVHQAPLLDLDHADLPVPPNCITHAGGTGALGLSGRSAD